MRETSFWGKWKQTIVLGCVLAGLQLAIGVVIHKRVDLVLHSVTGGFAPPEGAFDPQTGNAAIPLDAEGSISETTTARVYDPDDSPPSPLPDDTFNEELHSWLASVMQAEGGDPADLGDLEALYSERAEANQLLPPSEVSERVLEESQEYADAVGGDYVRGMLLLHALALSRLPEGGVAGGPGEGAVSLGDGADIDPQDGMGQETEGDVTSLDTLLSERLHRQAEEAGVDAATLTWRARRAPRPGCPARDERPPGLSPPPRGRRGGSARGPGRRRAAQHRDPREK